MHDSLPLLFGRYVGLNGRVAHIHLGTFPTPVTAHHDIADRLGAASFHVKHDGLSGEVYGGNKVRKLEFLFADALTQGRKSVVTYGAAGSNHALATAVYAQLLGLSCTNILIPQHNAGYVRKNLLMSHLSGAKLQPCPSPAALGETTERVVGDIERESGDTPYIIPMGGTSPVGMIGFINAACELTAQIDAGEIPSPDLIYAPFGSMGTAAGLAAGCRALGLSSRIAGVRVVPGGISNEGNMHALIAGTSALLHDIDSSFPRLSGEDCSIDIRHDYFGEEYALYTREGMRAIAEFHRFLSLPLEGTYTGKTVAAILGDAADGRLRKKNVLFWHTLNEQPYPEDLDGMDYHILPPAFHRYFEDDIQQLEREDCV